MDPDGHGVKVGSVPHAPTDGMVQTKYTGLCGNTPSRGLRWNASRVQFWVKQRTMSTAIATTVRKVPPMSWAEHKLFWALSVIDEEALKTFFRAVRKGAVRPPLLDEINAELDKGIGFVDMFANSESILKITGNDCIEIQVMWYGVDLRCTIRLGLMEWCGVGAEWDVHFDAEGRILEVSVQELWSQGGRREQPSSI